MEGKNTRMLGNLSLVDSKMYQYFKKKYVIRTAKMFHSDVEKNEAALMELSKHFNKKNWIIDIH